MGKRPNSLSRIALTAALALAPTFSPLETLAKNVPQQTSSARQVSQKDYSFLDVYNTEIDNALKYFEAKHKIAPSRNLIKAMIAVETGSLRDRKGAFAHDPMQIANQGDYALSVLADGKECTYLIGDFEMLKGKTKTPRKNGRWDYSNSNMNAKASIFGGIGWLYHKAAKYEICFVETGEFKKYVVNDGDTISKLASKLGTTKDSIRKNNPRLQNRKLKRGQEIIYRLSRRELKVSGWRTWEEAVTRYNGGGNPSYLGEVLEIKKHLDSVETEN